MQKYDDDADVTDGQQQKVRVADGRQVLVDRGVTYEVDSYVEQYSCKPPVLFIPIITALQVRTRL